MRRDRTVRTPVICRSVGVITWGSGGVPFSRPIRCPAAAPARNAPRPHARTDRQVAGFEARCAMTHAVDARMHTEECASVESVPNLLQGQTGAQ